VQAALVWGAFEGVEVRQLDGETLGLSLLLRGGFYRRKAPQEAVAVAAVAVAVVGLHELH